MRKSVIMVTVAIMIASTGILLYIASIGGFEPSGRVITDPAKGTETRVVENPAPPDHPAFPTAKTLTNTSG